MKKAILTLFKAPKAMQKQQYFFPQKIGQLLRGGEEGGVKSRLELFSENSSVLVLPGFPHPLCIGVIVIGEESVTV